MRTQMAEEDQLLGTSTEGQEEGKQESMYANVPHRTRIVEHVECCQVGSATEVGSDM